MNVLIGTNPMGLDRVLPPCGAAHDGVEFRYEPDRGVLREAIADADVYVGWLDRDAFLAAARLRWIQSPSSGTNMYLAIPELVEGEVLLTSARGTHANCVADSAFGMILSFTRGIRAGIIAQQRREWAATIRSGMIELTGTTMGIVGLGAIGQAVATRAKAFGMRVIAVDAVVTEPGADVETVRPLQDLNELMSEADIVVVTVPWTPEAEGLIDAGRIARMKETAMLVGISRGAIVDEEALAAALREERIACAALDVFAAEPLPDDSGLWDLDNLLIMPHVAGGSQLEGEDIADIFRENLGRFLRGERPLRNQVDKSRGF